MLYLIVGASGFIGSYIVESLLNKTKDDIVATYNYTNPFIKHKRIKWLKFDVRERAKERLSPFLSNGEPIKIIYLASFHHPDLVEKNFDLAWDINIVSLCRFLGDIGCFYSFFYASTDSVYGNGKLDRFFCEEDPLNPINSYGKQKVLSESISLAHFGRVIRFPFLIGPSKLRNKPHFFDEIVSDLKAKKVVRLFGDSYRSTLSFELAADLLVDVTKKPIEKVPMILNVALDYGVSKYTVGLKIAKKYGLDAELIKPIHQGQEDEIFQTPRAFVTLLDNTKLKKLLGLKKIDYEV